MYVSAPQANLRDHVATVYNRVGMVKNGERVEILERQRRFARVRTDQKQEGWIEMRSLVPREIFEQFQHMASENQKSPVQGHGVTRAELNMHASPGTRDRHALPAGGRQQGGGAEALHHPARHAGRDRGA